MYIHCNLLIYRVLIYHSICRLPSPENMALWAHAIFHILCTICTLLPLVQLFTLVPSTIFFIYFEESPAAGPAPPTSYPSYCHGANGVAVHPEQLNVTPMSPSYWSEMRTPTGPVCYFDDFMSPDDVHLCTTTFPVANIPVPTSKDANTAMTMPTQTADDRANATKHAMHHAAPPATPPYEPAMLDRGVHWALACAVAACATLVAYFAVRLVVSNQQKRTVATGCIGLLETACQKPPAKRRFA